MAENVVKAMIEIPLGSKNKYEIDPETGRIHLERVIYASMVYPAEYGYIEHTLAPDGDPLDIVVICSEPTFPGCIVPARVLGYLTMLDAGQEDYKLIAVADCDPRYDSIHTLEDLPPFMLKEVTHFFKNYKTLQGVDVTVGDYHSAEKAMELVRRYTVAE